MHKERGDSPLSFLFYFKDFDEVYQAALAAGSGGIRWNASNNYIQIRSTEGTDNWIDWRYYNTDYEVTHDLNTYGYVPSTTFTLSKRGLYCVHISYYANPGITTTGLVRYNYRSTAPGGNSSYMLNESIIYSDGNATVTLTNNLPTADVVFGGGNFIIYIGPFSNISSPSITHLFNRAADYSQTITTRNQFVHFVLAGKDRYNRNFVTEDIENKYITIYDPSFYNLYSAACLNRGGTVTCIGGCESQGSTTVGQYFVSSYTLVE